MMKVHAVVMRVEGKTWIDSLFVVHASAATRKAYLVRVLEAADVKPSVGCWISELVLEDAVCSE